MLAFAIAALVVPLTSGYGAPIVPAGPPVPGSALSARTDAPGGYPNWYQDSGGTRLSPCLDASDPQCILPAAGAEPGWNPALPLSFPDNFPSEFFYADAVANDIPTAGCAGSVPGKVKFIAALEGSFANGAPVPGDQITFGRIRVVVTSGLCPNTTYRFVNPYGVETLTTNASGAIPANVGTQDIKCLPVAPSPCDFTVALSSRVAGGFLRWDPAAAPAAPGGYLGDGLTPHEIVGSPTGTNLFRVETAGGVSLGQTNLFTVMGKLAGPLEASQSPVAFGGQTVGTTSAAQTLTVTNVGAAPLTISSSAIGGANAAQFAVAADGCAGLTLARDATCTVGVTFTPSAVGDATATLAVAHDQIRSPFVVQLHGTGTTPNAAPGAGLAPASLSFGSVRVITSTTPKRLTVTNTGSAPLSVQAALSGPDAGDYSVFFDRCSGTFVEAGASCTIDVVFAPTAAGTRNASLDLTTNAAGSPQRVPLTGTGTGGLAAVSGALDPNNSFPLWFQDENVVRVQPCLDAADPMCILPPAGAEPGFDPTQPTTFPGNFPSEFFYAVATSDDLVTPGCPAAGIASGRAKFRGAVEGSFANGVPVAGDQITFGRIRVTATGLCPNTTYAFAHPYGVSSFTTNDLGAIPANVGTVDAKCLLAPPTPCDNTLALRSPVFGGFLRWDPAIAPAAPAGYLGDPAVLHEVTGSPVGTNSFSLSEGGTLLAQTTLFTVSGKLLPLPAPAAAVAPAALSFANQVVNTTSTTQPVTVANTGNAPLHVSGLTIAGADFAVASNTCLAAAVAAGASCTVDVSFTPQALGVRTSSLLIADDAPGGTQTVALSGNGVPPPAPVVSLAPASLAFADRQTGTGASAAQLVTVSNTGTAPLTISAVSVVGANAADFAIASNGCVASIAIGGSCTVGVTFTPGAAGPRTASLQLTDNAAGSPHGVALSGNGVAPPPPPASFLVGDQTIEPKIDSNAPGRAEAFKTTAAASGSVTQLRVYVDTGSTATSVVVGLYANGATNHPATLLTSGTIAAPVAGLFNNVNVAAANVTAGTTYWIAVLGPAGTIRFRDRALVGSGSSETSLQGTLAGLPSSWSTGTAFTDGSLSGYGVGALAPADTTPPTVDITAPAAGATVSGTLVNVTATAADNIAVVGVQFRLDGINLGPEDTAAPFAVSWNTTAFANGPHALTAVARDAAGNTTASAPVTVTIANAAPPPALAVLVGNAATEAHIDSNAAGVAEAFRATAASSGTLTQLRVFVDGGSTATSVVVGLYSNSAAGHPGTLLTSGTIGAPVAGQNNVVAVPGAAVVAGQTYWLAVLGPSGTVRFRDRAAVAAGSSETSAQTTLSALPATWATGTSFADGLISAVGLG